MKKVTHLLEIKARVFQRPFQLPRAGAAAAADVAGPELWLLGLEPPPPRERRLVWAEERCGGGKEARPSLGAPAPRPEPPPPTRPCFDEPPYIGERFRERRN
ncbi:hypothetical protein Pyn_28705 [Prunus yedoensis var. nudiflora]|uniref:Uncharacterized protein n=1 Tax=Prunus yedoensis var. nudiflora TaxID=2094558 RepID=A0A315B069_PRUYE|nr:hypothetical protein Pyn_28705 [Prunus yedoensis var. nudiflora]